MSNKSSLLYVILLIFLPTIAISSSYNNGLKYKHFTLYQHDVFNQTEFVIVPGVILPNFPKAAAPFGRIIVLKDNLTLTPDPSSKVVGDCEALTVASSFDGLHSLVATRFALDLKDGLKGTISVLGVTETHNPSDAPVTGGTKDFVLVQGYITTSVVSFNVPFIVYKIDFHLFWPPYAPYAMKN